MTLTVLDLFSGIGGFSLGLDRTGGFRTVAFCEQNPYATAVLKRHWPGVPVFSDVRALGAATLAAAGIGRVGVVCGGFPCQDISFAGTGAGLDGARSGLWFEMLRIIAETRPHYVIAENVSALRSRGLDVVLGGLASIGYDAEWHCIPAAAVGAPHRRDRVWTIAYPNGKGEYDGAFDAEMGGSPESMGNPDGPGLSIAKHQTASGQVNIFGRNRVLLRTIAKSDWWLTEPNVGRVANGVPSRVDRLRCLGNAVVPQIPEIIGRAILSHLDSVSRARNVSVLETYAVNDAA